VSRTQIVPLQAVRDVILSLSHEEREAMIECLQAELDPPINAVQYFDMEGHSYVATALSNGWVVIHREDPARDLLHPRGKKLILFDLLDPASAIQSGLGLFR
jgi:hypothetical protein